MWCTERKNQEKRTHHFLIVMLLLRYTPIYYRLLLFFSLCFFFSNSLARSSRSLHLRWKSICWKIFYFHSYLSLCCCFTTNKKPEKLMTIRNKRTARTECFYFNQKHYTTFYCVQRTNECQMRIQVFLNSHSVVLIASYGMAWCMLCEGRMEINWA